MNKILLINKSSHNANLFSSFSINLGLMLSEKNKKILFISTLLSPNYLDLLDKNNKFDNKIKLIPPFNFYQLNNNFFILLLSKQKDNQININDIKSISHALKRQIIILEKDFDYLLIENNNLWIDLNNLIDQLNYNYKINVINTNDFTIDPIQNKLETDNDNIYCLLDFDPLNKSHLLIHKSLKAIFKISDVFVFNKSDLFDTLLFKAKRWDNCAIKLDELVKKIANNK